MRILIVDDEPLIRWSLSETLAAAGHDVEEAGSARQALDALSARSPEVVLLDLRMADSKDLSLLEHVRRLRPDAAVVMMTAFGTPEMIGEAERLGAFRVLNKPLEMNDLPALVQQARAARLGANRPH